MSYSRGFSAPKKGPAQLRHEERLRQDIREAEDLLSRLLAGERVGQVRKPVRSLLCSLASMPSARFERFSRETLSVQVLRVSNLSELELEHFAPAAVGSDFVTASIAGHQNASLPLALRVLYTRAARVNGHWDLPSLPALEVLPLRAAVVLAGAAPDLPFDEFTRHHAELCAAGLPVLEVFETLWRDLERSSPVFRRTSERVLPLLASAFLLA